MAVDADTGCFQFAGGGGPKEDRRTRLPAISITTAHYVIPAEGGIHKGRGRVQSLFRESVLRSTCDVLNRDSIT